MDGEDALESIEAQLFFTQQHAGYINSLSIDNVDRRLLLCGGADSSVTIWDVDQEPDPVEDDDVPWPQRDLHSKPLCRLPKKASHKFGISKLSWWPFNNDMFLTGSYDTTLKVWDTEGLEEVYSFDLDHKVYCFDINPLEDEGLVAAGLDHPNIRLVDLRVGGATQSLSGHSAGGICSIKWSPTREYMLASGGSDGTVRIWDIRRANQQVACMDMLRTNVEQELAPLEFRRSHRSACNGLLWHPSGDELLSLGLDNKVRIWDLTGEPGGGTNKSVNFGPLFQNRRQQNLDPCMTYPDDIGLSLNDDSQEEYYVMLPSDTGDVLLSQYSDGRLVKRLTPPGREVRLHRQASVISRGPKTYEFFSSTCDGSVVRWRPRELSKESE